MRIEGTYADEFLFGTNDNDLIIGGDGRDRVYGRGGNDMLSDDYMGKPRLNAFMTDQYYGGPGNDTLGTIDGNDLLVGGRGDDHFISTSDDSFMVRGGAGHDRLSIWQHGNYKTLFDDGNHIVLQHDDQIIDIKNVEQVVFHHWPY